MKDGAEKFGIRFSLKFRKRLKAGKIKECVNISYDLAVWHSDKPLTKDEAVHRYQQLCDGNISVVTPHETINLFYKELTALHPEIDDIPEEDIDNTDLCPWSIAFDKSAGHLIMCCVWPKAEHVNNLVKQLATKHSLSMFDPQTESLFVPNEQVSTSTKKPWWKLW
jgi:hypothetical protein